MPRLVLTRPHTHAGKAYAAGDRVEVNADIADWLLAHDIAVPEPKPTRMETLPVAVQRKEPKS